MIQRIQSVYLLLGALSIVLLLFFDSIWESEAAASLGWFEPALLISGAAAVVVALVSIFLYKDRARQRKVVVALLFIALVFMIVFYAGLFIAGAFSLLVEGTFDVSRLIALLLPVIAYIFFSLARRGIDRDIALVRSMDRLRG